MSKKVKKKSPMELSLDYLRKGGWTCQIVEHWNAFAKVRQDCFGFGDILAFRTGYIILVQTTSWDHVSHRRVKIQASPHYEGWKKAGGHIAIHGWGDKGLKEERL